MWASAFYFAFLMKLLQARLGEFTGLGSSLCAAFCCVWQWAEKHEPELRVARKLEGSA
jgi:hypothetical protein